MEPHTSATSPEASLKTSLLPSDSDQSDDHKTNELSPSIQFSPPHTDPIDFDASNESLQTTAGWALACFVGLFFLNAALVSYVRPNVGQPPACRKSSSMAVFSNMDASSENALNANGDSTFKKPGLNFSSDMLVVYSGMGHGHRLLNDTFAFDLQTRQWTRILLGKHEMKEPHPNPRWKSAAVSVKQGLLLLFGDALQRNDDGGKTTFSDGFGRSRKFDDHVWMLELPRLKWQAAITTEKERSSHASIPQARRGHSVNLLESLPPSMSRLKAAGAAEEVPSEHQIEQETTLLLFGGLSAQGEGLNDTWKGTISWPNITWTLLRGRTHDHLPTAATLEEGPQLPQRPSPRYGHATAILETSAETFQNIETRHTELDGKEKAMHRYIVMFGGRDKSQSFNDLWMLKLDKLDNNIDTNNSNRIGSSDGNKGGDDKSGEWLRFQVDDTSPTPRPRAYHTIVTYENKLYLFGGLSGPRDDISKPLSDLWVLSFESRRWYRLYTHGAWPLPRYLFASVVHQPQDATVPKLYIFGGESLDRCKLNDLWSLNLKSLIFHQLTPNFFAKRRCDKLFG